MPSPRSAFNNSISAAFGTVTASYAAIGSPTAFPLEWITIISTLNQDIILSTDGVNNMVYIPSGSPVIPLLVGAFRDKDVNALPSSTQFYIKSNSTLPTSGSISIVGVGLLS